MSGENRSRTFQFVFCVVVCQMLAACTSIDIGRTTSPQGITRSVHLADRERCMELAAREMNKPENVLKAFFKGLSFDLSFIDDARQDEVEAIRVFGECMTRMGYRWTPPEAFSRSAKPQAKQERDQLVDQVSSSPSQLAPQELDQRVGQLRLQRDAGQITWGEYLTQMDELLKTMK